jgi:hypothetical protein
VTYKKRPAVLDDRVLFQQFIDDLKRVSGGDLNVLFRDDDAI